MRQFKASQVLTEDEQVWHKFVSSRSVSLEDLHVDRSTNDEKKHEYRLCRYVDPLYWRTAGWPYVGCIWRTLKCLLNVRGLLMCVQVCAS